MTTTKQRIAALLVALMVAGAVATSATLAAEDAHAAGNGWGLNTL